MSDAGNTVINKDNIVFALLGIDSNKRLNVSLIVYTE